MPESIILEPEGRNTAPALTLAALALRSQAQGDEDPVILGFHADHAIGDVAAFRSAVEAAAELATNDCIATLGAPPDSPHTGYGYIRKGVELSVDGDAGNCAAYELSEFVEKPDEATAKRMLETGEYLWNSGMFFMRASVWIEELERFRPDIVQACRQAFGQWSQGRHLLQTRPEGVFRMSCRYD